MKQTHKEQEGMYPVQFAKGMRLRPSFDDRVIDSGAIAMMLAEKKRRQESIKMGQRRSFLSILKQKLQLNNQPRIPHDVETRSKDTPGAAPLADEIDSPPSSTVFSLMHYVLPFLRGRNT